VKNRTLVGPFGIIFAAIVGAPTGAAAQEFGDQLTDEHGNRAMYTPPSSESDVSYAARAIPQWAPFGPQGANARALSAHPTTANLLIAGVNFGSGGAIYRSTNGTSWTAATGTGTRAINAVEFASWGKGWAATDNGLFSSTDNGATWVAVTLPVVGQAVVRDLAVDPTDANIVWVGLGQVFNGTATDVVYKSIDNGASWVNVAPPVAPGMGATVLAIDPANPLRVYAAFRPNFGSTTDLWITTDGGTTWVERSAGAPEVPYNDIAFGNGKVYIAGGQDFGNQFMGLWTTPDDGQTWSDESGVWPSRAATSVAISPSNPQQILVGTSRAGLAQSTDGGSSWTFSAGNTGTYQVNAIEFPPTSAVNIYLGMSSLSILRSANSGTTYSAASTGISGLEITSIAVNPLNASEIACSYVATNDGGIYTTTDAGLTWTLSQAPLPRWQKVYFAPDGTLFGVHDGPLGRADDGLWRRNGDGTWSNLSPASPATLDTIGLEIAATEGANPTVLWAGYRNLPTTNRPAQVHSYNRSGSGAVENEYTGALHLERVTTLVMRGVVAVGGVTNFASGGTALSHILRSGDAGDTWDAPIFISPAIPSELTVGPAGDFYVVANPSTSNQITSTYLKSPDGATWTQQGTGPSAHYIAADPNTPGVIYSMWPFNNARPQRSTDDAASFQYFDSTYIVGPAGRAIVHGGTVGGIPRLYIATNTGAYMTPLAEAPACPGNTCGGQDYNGDGDFGTDQDIEAFFACLGGTCCPTCFCQGSDFNGDGDFGTDADIEAFFRVLGGGGC